MRRFLLASFLVALAVPRGVAFAAGPEPAAATAAAPFARLERALAPLTPLARSGILYDRVLPLAHLERFDGSSRAPAIDLATWRQGFDELRRAALAPGALPDLAALDADARRSLADGVIPLALFDRRYDRVRPEALADGTLRVEDDALVAVGGAALVQARAVAATALRSQTWRGADLEFELARRRFFTDDTTPPRALEADFDDGLGVRSLRLDERVRVRYATPGHHTVRLTITRADGSRAEAGFDFGVRSLAAPLPNDTLHVTGTIPYQGQFASGDAYVYLAPGHSGITNPIVVIEGFDLDNSMNWDELYALLNVENLLEDMRADGFDAVVLNFADATEAIEKNGLLVAELIGQVQAQIAPQTTLALVGASMGGLCSRYALAYMETHAMPHRVRTWIAFDSPQTGADIPLGLQYWINFFSSQSADAAAFLATLNRPAAREMLLYHYTTPAGATGQPDPMRADLAASFAAVGDWPTQPRRVAIANGSGTAANQGFNAGDQLIRWEYSAFFGLVAVTGNVWAVPDNVSRQIFQGTIRVFSSPTTQNVTVSGTKPWDSAPGGTRASLAELDAVAAPYGDIVALHPSHDFIPTVSALALNTTNPFLNVSTTPDPLALSPFDAIYWPAANQEHVLVTPENAAWVKAEVAQGLADVPRPRAGAGRGVTLAAAPNPFSGHAQAWFTLAGTQSVDVRVFGVDGREVRTLARGVFPAGTHAISWDGRDARGGRVPAGVYFLRLAAGDEVALSRVVRLD